MIQSILYRFIILTFSWYITHHEKGTIIDSYLYLGIVIYILLYLFFKYKRWSLPRLFLDFIFINTIIWGRDTNTSIIFLFILLPIINAINFSGNKTHSILMLLLTIITYVLHASAFNSWFFIPIISLWIIYLSSYLNQRKRNIINNVSQHIDGYFINNSEIQKPHLIYEFIIKDLNKYFFLSPDKGIYRIRTYTVRGNTLWLIRSSSFMWERKGNLQELDLERLRKQKVVKIQRSGKTNIYTYIKQGELEYIFICDIADVDLLILPTFMGFSYILLKMFSKVALLHNYEYRIAEMRNRKFDEIKDNVLYVNKAVKIMHFIRNRMTPLTNLVAFHKKQGEMAEETREKMLKYITTLSKQADNDLKEILVTADYLLEKSNNPFVEPELKKVHISKLYIFVAEIVERLLEGTVEADLSLQKEANSDLFVNINIIETKILLTDWINNMRKYMKTSYHASVSYTDGKIIVCFENDYDGYEVLMQQLAKDMNSTSKNAVLEGKDYGHGIYIIKSIATELNISIKAEIIKEDNKRISKFVLRLIFTTYGKEENTNI